MSKDLFMPVKIRIKEARVTLHLSTPPTPSFQRARGTLSISAVSAQGHGSRLQNLRQEGSYRAIFPRPTAAKIEAVAINTAGGVTGGDRFSITLEAHESAQLTLTTQAAERIYRAPAGDAGQITNHLSIAKGAQLFWLPQETILFEGCHLQRKLDVELDPSATALILEPLVFGREASGETLRSCLFRDQVSVTCQGQPIYLDRIQMNGDLAAKLARSGIAGGARAMASIVFIGADAHRMLVPCRELLPETAGASLLANNTLVVRMLAADSYALRTALLPILTLFTNDTVPKNWRL